MEFVNLNNEVKTKLCPSCYKEQPITEFEKIERGRVRICKLCRTCRNRQAREVYKKKGRPDRVSNLMQFRDIVMSKDLLNACLYMYLNHGVAIQVKQPIKLSEELDNYAREQACPRTPAGYTIKLAKVKDNKFVFNLYNSEGKYLKSKSLAMEKMLEFLK